MKLDFDIPETKLHGLTEMCTCVKERVCYLYVVQRPTVQDVKYISNHFQVTGVTRCSSGQVTSSQSVTIKVVHGQLQLD